MCIGRGLSRLILWLVSTRPRGGAHWADRPTLWRLRNRFYAKAGMRRPALCARACGVASTNMLRRIMKDDAETVALTHSDAADTVFDVGTVIAALLPAQHRLELVRKNQHLAALRIDDLHE